MPRTNTVLQIPDELKPADGRFGSGPSRIRPEQLGATGAGRQRGHGNLAPSGAGPGRGGADPSGPARAVLPPRRLRGRARQRRDDRVLGRGHVLPGARARAEPRVRRVLLEVRGVHAASAPFLADPIVLEAEPGDAPDAAVRPRRRRDRVGSERDLDRRDGPGLAACRLRRRPGADRCDVRRRRPAGRRRARGRVLLRAAEGPRLGRRPVARAAEPRGARTDRANRGRSRRRTVDSRVPLASDCA